jgi:hypothetical protein
MTERETDSSDAGRVTLDQIRHRADEVTELAVADAKAAASAVVRNEGARTLFVIAGAVVVVASLAYFAGVRSCRVREMDL